MRSVAVCDNHLSQFYEAIKIGNLPLMEKAEHELTASEKCVACAYVFKTRGTVREALEQYLKEEGLVLEIEDPLKNTADELAYWAVRFIVLFISILLVFSITTFFKNVILHVPPSFGIIEFIIIGLAALALFIFIDDKFLE